MKTSFLLSVLIYCCCSGIAWSQYAIPAKTIPDFPVQSVSRAAGNARHILLEEASGAWCGACPAGGIAMEELQKQYDNITGVVLHQGDSISTPEGNEIISTYFSSYPSGMVDRYVFPGTPSAVMYADQWPQRITQRLALPSPVGVTISKMYNPDTRTVDFTVTANFTEDVTGDVRINAYIVEDKVRGQDVHDAWTQHNYYSKEYSELGVGTPLYDEPEWLVGYYHNHAVRSIPSGAWGTQGVIPSSVKAGEAYSQSYSYTLPPVTFVSYPVDSIMTPFRSTFAGQGMNKPEDTRIVAFISYYTPTINTREVLNAVEIPVASLSTDIRDNALQNESSILVYPQPVFGQSTIRFTLPKHSHTSVRIVDALGQTVQALLENTLPEGEHIVQFSASSLHSGMYIVRIDTDAGVLTQKFVVGH